MLQIRRQKLNGSVMERMEEALLLVLFVMMVMF